MTKRTIFLAISVAFLASSVAAQGYVWTYQGKLTDGGFPANGVYDIRITQLEAIDQPIGTDTIFEDVQVVKGVFSVNVTTGALILIENRLRFIEIAVRPGASTGAFTVLAPRQPVNMAPYAGRAATAAEANYAVRSTQADTATNSASADFALSSGTITSVLPVEKGGTGGITAAGARSNLGLGSLSTVTPSGSANSSNFLRGDNTWSQPPLVFIATAARGISAIGDTTYLYPNGRTDVGTTGTASIGRSNMRVPRACTFRSFKVTVDTSGYGSRRFYVVRTRGGVELNILSIHMTGSLSVTSTASYALSEDDLIVIKEELTDANTLVANFYFSMVCE